jgi:spore coat protein U-like protein
MSAGANRFRPAGMACALAAALLLPVPYSRAANCGITSPGLDFGNYDPVTAHAAAPMDASSSLTVTCTKTQPGAERVDYVVSVSAGNSGSFAARRMLGGAEWLLYNLYTTGQFNTVLGDGSQGSAVFSGRFTLNNPQPTQSASHTYFGRIPGGQNPAGGTAYTDILTLTVTF